MAEGSVNNQIIDSVKQTAIAVLGQAPAQTTGMLDAVMTETIGMAMYNAVTTQHNSQMVASAAIAATCARMLRVPSALPLPLYLVKPAVTGVDPLPIPANSASQSIQVLGSDFQNGLKADVFNANGNKIGALDGSAQIAN